MRVAVTSASGQLGGAIVKALVEEIGAGKVVAIARKPEKAENLGVEVRKGDYDTGREHITWYEYFSSLRK